MGFATHHTHHTLDPYPPLPLPFVHGYRYICMGKGTGQIFLPQGYPDHSLDITYTIQQLF